MTKLQAEQNVELIKLLREAKTIAVVGLSPKPTRPSYQVATYLLGAGYEIIPVNPGHEQIMGLPCYPDLASIPQQVDIVDIFRNPSEVPAIVDSAIAIGAKVLWMQIAIVHEEAAAKARAAGLVVIMDRCLATEHQKVP